MFMTVLIWVSMSPNWRYFSPLSQSTTIFYFLFFVLDEYLYILVFAEIDFEIVLMLLMSFLFPSLVSCVEQTFFFSFAVKGGLDCICGEAWVLFWCCSQWACHQWWGNGSDTTDWSFHLLLLWYTWQCRIFLNILIKYFSDVYDIVMLGFDGWGIFCLM